LKILQLDTAAVTRIHVGPEPAGEEGFTAPWPGTEQLCRHSLSLAHQSWNVWCITPLYTCTLPLLVKTLVDRLN